MINTLLDSLNTSFLFYYCRYTNSSDMRPTNKQEEEN
jgi:hypothetical protein